ncbi:c-type cytochrome domain-containing protein [Halomonas urumqiensis]|nr:c-type cytochrome domain-containing protein [Halomonas urumqiensis]
MNQLDGWEQRSVMSMSPGGWIAAMALWLGVITLASAQVEDRVTYPDVASILAERCVMCHAGERAMAGLRLDSFEGVVAGSGNGPVVRGGDPDTSELILRLRGEHLPRMPMTGPPFLADDEIALFERWVAQGLSKGEAKTADDAAVTTAPRPAPGERVTYTHVAPILARHCARCHTDNGLHGPAPEGYRLTSLAATLSPSDRVRVVPGHPEASELMRRIRGQARPRMPLDAPPLSDDEIQLVETWIREGARDASGQAAPMPVGAKVRLHGRLGEQWQLDGLPLAVGSGTRIDKSPRPGDYVQVRGRLAADATVRVERLRRR